MAEMTRAESGQSQEPGASAGSRMWWHGPTYLDYFLMLFPGPCLSAGLEAEQLEHQLVLLWLPDLQATALYAGPQSVFFKK